MTQDEVVKEFARTQRRAFKFGWPPIVIGFAGVAYAMTHIMQLSDGTLKVMFVVSIALFGLGSAVVGTNVCPLCKQVPMAGMAGGRGVMLFPEVCPNCGVRLKADPNAPITPVVAPVTLAATA